jgi:hypothetical protein
MANLDTQIALQHKIPVTNSFIVAQDHSHWENSILSILLSFGINNKPNGNFDTKMPY